MSSSNEADMEDAQCAHSIHLIGFPRADPHTTNETANAPVLQLVEDLVPEAQIVRHDIFSIESFLQTAGQYMKDDDERSVKLQEDVEWGNTGLHSVAEKTVEQCGDSSREDKEEKERAGSNFDDAAAVEEKRLSKPEHTEITGYSEHLQARSINILSRDWIEMKALALLDAIHKSSLKQKRTDHGKILLAGYGFGGIIVKHAVIIANTTPKYYNIAFRISNLVFFATPHRLNDRISWEEILLDMITAADPSRRYQLLRNLAELADSVSQLSFLFHRFLAKYSITNFIEGKGYRAEHPVVGKLGLFDSSLEVVVKWDDVDFSTIGFCGTEDVDKLEKLRMHFFPPHFSDRELSISLYGAPEVAMGDSYFQALQAFSPSRWIFYEARAPCHPDSFDDLKKTYQPLLNAISWEDVQKRMSVQVFGPTGYGKSTLLKFISHELRQHLPTVVIENFLSAAGAYQPTLHGLYVSFLHQAISQRPSMFWPFRSLADEILRQSTWSEESLRILLTSMLSRSQGIKFQIIIYDFEHWPNEICSWWCTTLSKILRTCGSTFVFLTSSHDPISGLDPSTPLYLDLREGYSIHRERFIRTKVESLANHGSESVLSCSGLGCNLAREIASRATMFQGSLTATNTFLLSLFESFRLNTPEAVMADVRNSPQTEAELYSRELQSLDDTPRVFHWISSTLSWLRSPIRPLRVEELAVAAAIDLNEPSLEKIRQMVSINVEQDLQRQLGAFVTIENRLVRICNTSARRILVEQKHMKQPLSLENDSGLTKLCLHYLTVILQEKKPETWDACLFHTSWKDQARAAPDPALEFLDYSCRFWPAHFVRVKDPEESLKSVVVEFLLNHKIAGRWFELYLLCNSMSTYPFQEDAQRIKSLADIGGTVPTTCDNTNSVTKELDESQSLAVLIASFVGVDSVIPQILNYSETPKIETLKLRRGYSERDASYLGPQKSLYLDCAISNDDDSTVLALLEADQTWTAHEFPLHRAALLGCSRTVQALLRLPKYLEQIDEKGRTPLHMAAIGGNTGIIRLFLDDLPHLVVRVDGDSRTPLILACQTGNIDAAKLLTEISADVSFKDNVGKTALHYAVLNCPEAVQDLIHQDLNLVGVQDNEGRTPLHIAARSGSKETSSILLRAVGDKRKAINTKDNFNKIPLHYASESGYTDVVQVLLEKIEASSDINNENYVEAAERAAEHGHLATMKVFTLASNPKRPLNERLLETACRSGQLLVVKHLLSKNISPDGDESRNSRPLSLAVSKGHKEVVDALLQRKANVNIEDAARKTPLHYAAECRHHDIALLLLDFGANVNAPDFDRYTPLHEASRAGCVKIIELLLNRGAYVEACSRTSETPLHLAVKYPEAIGKLLEKKADKDASDMFNRTPLHMATLNKNCKSVEQLIIGGASIDARDDDGFPPIYHAIIGDDLEMVKTLCGNLVVLVDSSERMQQALEWAVESFVESSNRSSTNTSAGRSGEPPAESVKMELLKYLLSKSVDAGALNLLGSRSSAVIHKVVEMDAPIVLNLLLENKADVNLKDRMKRTPLHHATRYGRLENMKILMKEGAMVDAADGDGETPLHVAADQGTTEAIVTLLDYGADINRRETFDGRTPLYMAAYSGHVEAVRLLLEKKAGMEVNSRGWSPLHASADDREITKMLLDHGAIVNLKKNDAWTALHLATNWSQHSVVEVLLENGANPNDINDDRETALHLAIRGSQSDIAKLLLAKGADCTIKSRNGASCATLAVDYNMDSGEVFEKLLSAYSAPGEEWHSEEAIELYWKAIEIRSMRSLRAIVERADHLFGKVNSSGLTALQACLQDCDKDWDFATELVKLGACPFIRDQPQNKSCFELGFSCSEDGFINTCLNFVKDASTAKSMGFKDLRIVTELDKSDFWAKDGISEALNSLNLADSLATDHDDWNLWHFIHQAGDRVPVQFDKTLLANPTKKPSGLLMPSSWISEAEDGSICEISPGGLEASFKYHFSNPVCLRADFPFPPGEREMAYFEITICDTDERSSRYYLLDDFLAVGIGFCSEFCNLERAHTGWKEWSVGYHGDDGFIFDPQTDWHPERQTFKIDDIVGCGIDYTTMRYYFTLNGEVIYRSPPRDDKNNIVSRKLYPTISHRGIAAKILVNFGTGDDQFAWVGARKQRKEDGRLRLRRRETFQELEVL